ncbi:MAG: alpha/beta fold hydrolase [Acidimicrobiales bacterium]
MPETSYARRGDLHVAYQTVGTSDLNLVLVGNWFGNIELMWQGQPLNRFLQRLSSFSRLLIFDKLGVGLSDPVTPTALPTLEEWIGDIRVVMDDTKMERAALVGAGTGGPMVMQFAATHPERVTALILVNTYARFMGAPDYPHGITEDDRERLLKISYVDDRSVSFVAGASGDEGFRSWWRHYLRQSVSPGTASAMRRAMFDVDVRSVLPAICVPTLILHRRDNNWVRAPHALYLAEHIPNATLVEVPGDEDIYFLGDADRLLDEIEEFLTGMPPAVRSDRRLATMLFTDIVDSTATASRLGDRRWHELLDRHDAVVEVSLEHFQGRKVNPTGDGMLAVFDGPGRAIACARALHHQLSDLGLDIRAGIHTGEVEVRGDDIAGLGVNVAARISALAKKGEILVSSTVRQLVSGSGTAFIDRGATPLKGVDEEWHIYQVAA